MPEITVRDWEDTDLDEVASLTFNALQDSPFFSPERTLEDVEGRLNWNHKRFPPAAMFQAHIGGGLVGWLTVTVDVKPGISETWRWVPYISPEARGREDGIARGLIRRCIEYVMERGQTRLEVCFDRISDATMPHYERYRAWFEAEGVYKVDDSAYMRRGLSPPESLLRTTPSFRPAIDTYLWSTPTRTRCTTVTAVPSRRAASGRTTT